MTDEDPPEWIFGDTDDSYTTGSAADVEGSVEVCVTDTVTENASIEDGLIIASVPKEDETDEPTDGLVLKLTDEHTTITLELDSLQREWFVKMLENAPEGYAYHDGDRLAYNEDVSTDQ